MQSFSGAFLGNRWKCRHGGLQCGCVAYRLTLSFGGGGELHGPSMQMGGCAVKGPHGGGRGDSEAREAK